MLNIAKRYLKMCKMLKDVQKNVVNGRTDEPTDKKKQSRVHMTKNREWLINDLAKVLEIKEIKPKQKTQASKRKS